MTKHSNVMGGSTAERRIHCPGSAALEAAIPSTTSTYAAAEGTALHDAMYKALMWDQLPERNAPYIYTDKREGTVDVSPEVMEEKFWSTYEAMMEFEREHNILAIDCEVSHAHLKTAGPDVYGTGDYIGRSKYGYAIVADFKFGSGNRVSPVENFQLAFYAQGAIDNDDSLVKGVDKFILAIVQPWRDGTIIQEWETTRQWLEDYARLEAHAYERIKTKDKTLRPGKWCKFCRAQAGCKPHLNNLRAGQEIALSPMGDLTKVELARLLDVGEKAVDAYKAVQKFAQQEAERGVDIPGFKLVQSIGNRAYIDPLTAEAEASGRIGLDAYEPPKLRSPAQLEKVFKKAGANFEPMNAFIHRPLKGTRLVRDSHPGDPAQIGGKLNLPDDVQGLLSATKGNK